MFMSSVIEYVSGRLFIDGVWGNTTSNSYFSCHYVSCPFSLKVIQDKVGGQKVVVGVEKVLFGHHNHEPTDCNKIRVRSTMKQALDAARLFPEMPEAIRFKAD